MSDPDPAAVPTVRDLLAAKPPTERRTVPPHAAPPAHDHRPADHHGHASMGTGHAHAKDHKRAAAPLVRAAPAPRYAPIDVPVAETLAIPTALRRRERDYDPTRARADVADLIATLRAHGGDRVAYVQTQAAVAKQSAATHAKAQQAHAHAAASSTLGLVVADIKHARTSVAAGAKQHQALALAVASAGYAQLLGATSASISTMEAAKSTAETTAHTSVARKQAAARKLGNDEIARAKTGMTKQAQQARDRAARQGATYPDDERGDVQRRAVLDVGEEARRKLLEPFPDLESSTRTAATELAGSFADAADHVVDGFGDQVSKVSADLTQRAVGTAPDFQRIGKEAGDAMDHLRVGTWAQLDDVERQARGDVASLASAVDHQIEVTLRGVQADIDAETAAMTASITSLVERAAFAALRIERPYAAGLRAGVDETTKMIDEGVAGFEQALRDLEHAVAAGLDAAGKGVAGNVAAIGARVSVHLGVVVTAATKGLVLLLASAQDGSNAYNAQWATILVDSKGAVDKAFADAIAKMEAEIDKTIAEGKPKLVDGVDGAIAENQKILDGLDASMEKAADQAAYKYDHPIRYKLKKAFWVLLGGLVKLVALVALAIAAVIAIFVGLLSGLVWLVVLGVIALVAVVGYVLYGLISGIVNRIRSANTWFDGVRGFFIGILDITGVPNIVEGITEQDLVNGRQLTLDEAADRLGGGVLGAVTFFVPFIKGLKGLRGAPKGITPIEVPIDPIEGASPGLEPPPVEPPPAEPPPIDTKPAEPAPPDVTPDKQPGAEPSNPLDTPTDAVKDTPKETPKEAPKDTDANPAEPAKHEPADSADKAPDEASGDAKEPTETGAEPTAEEPVSQDVSPEQAEGEKMAEAEDAETSDRLKADSLEDMKQLERPFKKYPPEGAKTPLLKKLWGDYVDYWNERIGELKDFIKDERVAQKAGKTVEGTKPRSPLTWDAYAKFRGKFLRGMEFQRRVTKALRGQFKSLRIADEVAVESPQTKAINKARREAIALDPDGEGTRPAPTRADQLAFDRNALRRYAEKLETDPGAQPPEGEAFSNKSRARRDYASDSQFLDQAEADAHELVDKYSGEVEIRSNKFGGKLLGKTVTIKKVYLVFDKALIEGLADDISERVKSVSVATGVDIEVLFQ